MDYTYILFILGCVNTGYNCKYTRSFFIINVGVFKLGYYKRHNNNNNNKYHVYVHTMLNNKIQSYKIYSCLTSQNT